jgi:AhpD family alkylhydroperoxidase
MDKLDQFKQDRTKLNEITFSYANVEMKKFFHLDSTAYADGVLSSKTKEMLGFVSSLVLRCDDCILYHLDKCISLGVTKEEMIEVMNQKRELVFIVFFLYSSA